MEFNDKYGNWAMIAGSADGLGKAYSRALAGRNMNLIMIDHQHDLLESLAEKLEQEFGISTRRLHLDLATDNAVQEIMVMVKSLGCRLLIYNAAFSLIKAFPDQSEEELDQLIKVNTRTPLKLTHAFVNHLLEKQPLSEATGESSDKPDEVRQNNEGRPRGGIILMSSLSGLLGMQLVAPYAASKAFNWNLAESLHHELKPFHIDVMACVSGIIATPAYLDSQPYYGLFKPYIMQPAAVAEATLDKLGRKVLFTPGFRNRLNYFFLTRLLCRPWAARLANKVMAGLYKDHLPERQDR